MRNVSFDTGCAMCCVRVPAIRVGGREGTDMIESQPLFSRFINRLDCGSQCGGR